MKLHFSKEWLRKRIEEDKDDIEDCCMAMSPSLYLYSQVTTAAMASSAIKHILYLAEVERDFTQKGAERFTWMMERAMRYTHRMAKLHEKQTVK